MSSNQPSSSSSEGFCSSVSGSVGLEGGDGLTGEGLTEGEGLLGGESSSSKHCETHGNSSVIPRQSKIDSKLSDIDEKNGNIATYLLLF